MENGTLKTCLPTGKTEKQFGIVIYRGQKCFFMFCIFWTMLFSGSASAQSLLKEFSGGDGHFCTTTVYLLEDSIFGIESGCEGRSRFTFGKYEKTKKSYVLHPYRAGEFNVISGIQITSDDDEPADTLEIVFMSQDDSVFSSFVQFADSYEALVRWQAGDSITLTPEPPGGTWQDLPGYKFALTSGEMRCICFTALSDLTGQRITAAVPENVHKVTVHVNLPYALLVYVSGLYESVYEELEPGTMKIQKQVFRIE